MKNYHVTMDDGHEIDVKSTSAADAIQSALVKHIGHRVTSCTMRQPHTFTDCITYEIPPHEALMEKPEARALREPKFESDENRKERERPAPWIEEWLKTKSAPM